MKYVHMQIHLYSIINIFIMKLQSKCQSIKSKYGNANTIATTNFKVRDT